MGEEGDQGGDGKRHDVNNSESDILTQGVMMKDMQKISETEGPRCPSAVKKELADCVKVARDMSLGDSAKSECQEDLGRERQANS